MLWNTALVMRILGVHLLAGLAAGATQPATKEQIAQFVRYAQISTVAYQSTCKTPPGNIQIIEPFTNAQTDTNGFIAKDVAAKEIIVAFRGTNDVKDIMTDLNFIPVDFQTVGVTDCNGCQVHKGFLDSWNSVADQIMATVKKELAAQPGSRLTITGHSLGAALVSLSAMSMIGSGMPVEAITFGQPRTGNKAFADFVDRKAPDFRRVTHANDGVPQIPLNLMNFQHHSTEYWQPGDKAEETVRCEGQEPKDCNNSEPGVGLNGLIINLAHLSYMGVQMGNTSGAGVICGQPDGLLSPQTGKSITDFFGITSKRRSVPLEA